MKLYLVRHGESKANTIEQVYNGQIETPLTKKGKKQIERIAERLKDYEFDSIYSSDLERAALTAKGISKHHKIEPILDKRLREYDRGDLTGKSRIKYPTPHPFDNPDYKSPNGETFVEMVERVADFLDEHITEKKDKNILLVTHEGTMRAIFVALDLIGYNSIREYKIPNTSLFEIEVVDKKAQILLASCVKHLEGLE